MKRNDLFDCFPAAAMYRGMRMPAADRVREAPAAQDAMFSERHLQCVWADAALRPAALCTRTGEQIVVVDPGRWNLERGPDFLDAVIEVGPDRRRRRGDIELHIRPSDWLHHGHQADPHYARVIAHVCYFDGPLPCAALPPGTLHIALKDALLSMPGFSFDAVDLTAYPYAVVPADPPPCAEALARLPVERAEALLDAAGAERMRRKAVRIEVALRDRDAAQCLYEELMGTLGYKQNQRTFRDLARRIPLEVLQDETVNDPEQAYAMLLGIGGLLPHPAATYDAQTCAFVRRLWDAWWKKRAAWQHAILPPGSWQLAGQRPLNHPVRRLAAAAALFAPSEPLASRLPTPDPRDPSAWFAGAAAVIQSATGMEYWARRLTFAGQPTRTNAALLGRRRVAAILSNVLLPFLAAQGTGVAPLLDALPPEQDNALVRQTAYALFGRDHNPALYHSGLRQQGLMQIFHDFCIHTRTGCPACPLTAALQREAGPPRRAGQGAHGGSRPTPASPHGRA